MGILVTTPGPNPVAIDGPVAITGPVEFQGAKSDTELSTPRLDRSTHALETIDYPHHEIHSGSHYECTYNQLVSDTADKSIVAFKTPNTAKYLHILFLGSGSSAAKFYMLRAPTITDNQGTSLTIFNNNHNSANTSGVIDTSQNPDVVGQAMSFDETDMAQVSGGTKIGEVWFAAEKKKGGGEARGDSEHVLSPNTLYAFVIESLSNDDNYHSIKLEWYEHTDKV